MFVGVLLTVLYALLFVASGAILLILTNAGARSTVKVGQVGLKVPKPALSPEVIKGLPDIVVDQHRLRPRKFTGAVAEFVVVMTLPVSNTQNVVSVPTV